MSPQDLADRISVYVLDDHELLRRGMRELLGRQPDIDVVGESGSASEAIEQILELKPDVAILDCRLPDGTGSEVCRRVRAKDRSIAVLMLTSYDDDEELFSSITAGASGFVLKQVRGEALVDDVRRLAAGESILDPAVTARVMDRLRRGPRVDPALVKLSEQERKILHFIGEGMTNKQIAAAANLAEKTVKNYVSAILSKLGMQRRAQAAAFAARHPEG